MIVRVKHGTLFMDTARRARRPAYEPCGRPRQTDGLPDERGRRHPRGRAGGALFNKLGSKGITGTITPSAQLIAARTVAPPSRQPQLQLLPAGCRRYAAGATVKGVIINRFRLVETFRRLHRSAYHTSAPAPAGRHAQRRLTLRSYPLLNGKKPPAECRGLSHFRY